MDQNAAQSETPTIIRHATGADVHLVFNIMKAAFAEYVGVLDPPSGVERETENDVADSLHRGGMLVAFRGETAVGIVRYRFEEGLFYVGRLGVLPAFRGLGIGSELMKAVEAIAVQNNFPAIQIIVRQTLEANLKLYRRLGYTREEWVNHPKAGKAVIMYKDLASPNPNKHESGRS